MSVPLGFMEFHSTHDIFFAAMHREMEFKMFISLLINDNFFKHGLGRPVSLGRCDPNWLP